jgi:hypothetical protein
LDIPNDPALHAAVMSVDFWTLNPKDSHTSNHRASGSDFDWAWLDESSLNMVLKRGFATY